MRHLQHLYSAWYNRSRPIRRRGPLWAGRFKNTVLEDGAALWACWTYIERNPVRAGMVEDAADYRFCSYGRGRQSGRHPFAAALEAHLIPSLPARPQKTLEPTSQTAVHLPGIRPTRPLSLGIRSRPDFPPQTEQPRRLCRYISVPSTPPNWFLPPQAAGKKARAGTRSQKIPSAFRTLSMRFPRPPPSPTDYPSVANRFAFAGTHRYNTRSTALSPDLGTPLKGLHHADRRKPHRHVQPPLG